MDTNRTVGGIMVLALGCWLAIFFSVTLLGAGLTLLNQVKGNPNQDFMGTGVDMSGFLKAVSMWGRRGVNIAESPDIGAVDALFRIILGVSCAWFGSMILALDSLEKRPQPWYVKIAFTVFLAGFFLSPSFRATLRFLWGIRGHLAGIFSLTLYPVLYLAGLGLAWRMVERAGSAVIPYFKR